MACIMNNEYMRREQCEKCSILFWHGNICRYVLSNEVLCNALTNKMLELKMRRENMYILKSKVDGSLTVHEGKPKEQPDSVYESAELVYEVHKIYEPVYKMVLKEVAISENGTPVPVQEPVEPVVVKKQRGRKRKN